MDAGKNILSKASGVFSNMVPNQKPKITTFSLEDKYIFHNNDIKINV